MTKKAVLLVFLGVLFMVPGCGTQPRRDVPSAVQAASPQHVPTPDQNAKAAAPSQEPAAHEPDASASQPTAPKPDLNYLMVDVVDQGVVWNDWSQSRIRVIKTTDESGDDIYFYCDTAIRGAQNQILMVNGKPIPNLACFQPRLHVVYTLHDDGGGDGWYYMYPPGDDGSDEGESKRPLVRYCPKCAPDGDSQ